MSPRRPLPDSRTRRTKRRSEAVSRWIFWGGFTIVVLLLLAVLFLA